MWSFVVFILFVFTSSNSKNDLLFICSCSKPISISREEGENKEKLELLNNGKFLYGTETDRGIVLSTYFKIGACIHDDYCSRLHTNSSSNLTLYRNSRLIHSETRESYFLPPLNERMNIICLSFKIYVWNLRSQILGLWLHNFTPYFAILMASEDARHELCTKLHISHCASGKINY